ncbi:MAG: hypothetical protein K0Q95_876 [Bacteroidota bacterium]|jgi:uncharacterized repeat protein (TIGR03803 family)|nr:hypothetical protein [Bacteroidota bacterium]
MKKITLISSACMLAFNLFFPGTGFSQYTKLLDFNGANGARPDKSSFYSDGTFLYATTQFGGTNDMGTVFKIKPDGSGYMKLLDFSGQANGKWPHSALISDGTYLYGTTSDGGNTDIGVIFKIKPDGTGFAKVLDFNGTNGGLTEGSLLYDGTYLYGMSLTFGPQSNGLFYKIKPDGTGYVDMYDCFNSGTNPYGAFISVGTYLYGMTQSGGAGGGGGCGYISKIKPDGTGYADVIALGTVNACSPYGSLTSVGPFLYGMTAFGGTNNLGNVFKIKPDGTGYASILDFAGSTNGSTPIGSLISDGTYLYGMTARGGSLDSGTVFKVKTDGTGYIKLIDFTGPVNGSYPYGTLYNSGSYLYGMTSMGGTNGLGTIFKLGTVAGIEEMENNTAFGIYPNPFSTSATIEFKQIQHQSLMIITDVLGKEVKTIRFSGTHLNIEKEELKNGIYFVRVIDQHNNASNQKIIIQ